jgi:hypothetical protein
MKRVVATKVPLVAARVRACSLYDTGLEYSILKSSSRDAGE